MKLINKISRYFLISASITLLLFATLLFVIIEKTITNEVDEQLATVYKKVVKEITVGQTFEFPPLIEIKSTANEKFKPGFSDIYLGPSENGENEPYRQLSGIVNFNNKNFFVTVRISLIEKEDMFFSIFLISVGSLLFILIIVFLINKHTSQKVFKDFYNTLEKLGNFSLSDNQTLQLSKSNIEEFTKLNEVVERLSQKAKSEYRSLKEFTEETNHEIQTPVAIVKSKLEMLLQSENLKEKELNYVNSAINNLNKLEHLNRSILLLNKLDYKNLFEDSLINFSEEINKVLSNYSEFINSKKIKLSVSLNENIRIKANTSLINILLSNLISNSIKHNVVDGELLINLNEINLIISNTGLPIKQNPEQMFKKFRKGNENSDSVGLGLAIAKKICDLYSIKIHFETIEHTYKTTLTFNNTEVKK